ncbi:MAG TPA: helix-turn-helix domain-containing GNAT family N-acetyltransferase [Rhizobiaceae bacterium]|nr:helix-turn-helix domain-containing GNAT family N-acetyltransferase [Rhizobiaceae bacterium]
MSAADPLVSDIRRFNRFYTRTIGLLDETLTKSPFTLAEARVLFELGAGQTTASGIADALRVDAAYLARIIERHRKAGLLTVTPATDDRRRKVLALTDKGRAALGELKAAADHDVSELTKPLGSEDRARLATAMATVETVLSIRRQPEPVMLRPHEIGDVGWVIERQSRMYASEYGWNGEYEALVCEIGADFIRNFKTGKDFCWVAERDGVRLGAVFLIGRADGDGQLRMLHVERDARGQGVGSMLIGQCVETARRVGYPKLVLWTNDVLSDARRLYERAGFMLAEEERHHSFGKDLVGQNWELVLG